VLFPTSEMAKRTSQWSGGAGLAMGLILALLEIAQKNTPPLTVILLTCIFLALSYSVYRSNCICNQRKAIKKIVRMTIGPSLILGGLIPFGLWVWPNSIHPFFISSTNIVGGVSLGMVDENRTSVLPLRLAIQFNLTNLQQRESMVRIFDVEGMDDAEVWSELNRVSTGQSDQLYWGENLTKLKLVEMTFLDRELHDRNLHSGETVSGWMLFTNPQRKNFSKLRVTIGDSVGTYYTSEPFSTSGNAKGQLDNWILMLHTLPGFYSLEHIPIQGQK